MKPSKGARSPAMLVPAGLLLCSIAVHGFQIVAHEDDPQRSGAFAMFSTIDIGATRKVLATAAEGTVVLDLPTSLNDRATALLDHPVRGGGHADGLRPAGAHLDRQRRNSH